MDTTTSLFLLSFILGLPATGATETSPDPALAPGELSLQPALAAMESARQTMLDGHHQCMEMLGHEAPRNRTGPYCNRTWDGLLCWDETPAGTFATLSCPDYPGLDTSEKVTKYCDESGYWFQSPSVNRTWAHCLAYPKDKLKIQQSISTLGSLEPNPNAVEERTKIMDGQYKCFEKMNMDRPYNKSGLFCNRTWDGWMCWDDTPAGTYGIQNCPNYFPDFDPTEKVTKYCDEHGNWFRHPDTNRSWSNYTLCTAYTYGKVRMVYVLYYMAVVGHSLSLVSLLISLAIFFYFRSLSCQRITLHKNLFTSYVLNSTITIIYFICVVNNPKMMAHYPMSCKMLQCLNWYLLGCTYFWMLCEGVYLHTLIVVAVFAEEQHLYWYYLLGWGFPLVPTVILAIARKQYFDDHCWLSLETHLLYVVHGPIVAALLVNLFFLLNIVRVLVTKLRNTHRAESNMYMKAVRATLILVPLLGIQFVILLWRPENRLAGEIYDVVINMLMHNQGLLVATIFCFFNGEVQGALKRQWVQYKAQWGQRRKEHCSMRSTSYTATSITEVPNFMYHHDCGGVGGDGVGEQPNGRPVEDCELVALKFGDTYTYTYAYERGRGGGREEAS
ncbi:hypothetical protein AALO_G00257580 [Alosa alosa]|uniref:Calcitonin gene-related peptide type 1 receptor n=1 Tax=Alosa alosa TaxID=278164 RepID=A0AAV6FQA3_9TELE|nr:calcitonin gene-related peptide type 1 receptor [Alosa alosa]XP_048085479.1 calcitonin gene-related peptide type 1 receptor [Alosa alosa]KAG5264745.1 hypothetical protein AALO_G00257580 [Alosa alosa]